MRRLFVAAMVAAGCSPDAATVHDTASGVEVDQGPDVSADIDESDTSVEPDTAPLDVDEAETSEPPDVVPDDGSDTADVESDTEEVDTSPDPVPCDEDEACGVRLDEDGLCAGACVPQDFGLHCAGTVSLGLCYTGDPPPKDITIEGVEPGITWTAPAIPSETAVGDTIELVLTGVNSGAARTLDVYGDWSPDWELVASTVPEVTLTLPAGSTTELTVTLRALRANAVEPWNNRIGTLYLGQNVVSAYSAIAYGPDAGLACGTRHFPATFCPTGECTGPMGGFYVSAQCCDDVFYPGVLCCTDDDCFGGACVDGRCLYDVPTLGWANSVPAGRQRVLLVLVDQEGQPQDDVCADRAATLSPALDLPGVEAWFDAVSEARVGRDLLTLDWVVLTGARSADFASEPEGALDVYARDLDEWLGVQGCSHRFEQFDKVIVVTPTANLLGSTAVAISHGLIGSRVADQPLLFAHELGHTYGGTDLYLDLGAQFRYRIDLMGNNLGYLGTPRDGVLRGEAGYMDVNHDGVVDVAEFAVAPDALAVLSPTLTATKKGTLELAYELVGLEDGVSLRTVIPESIISVPDLLPPRDVNDSRQRKVLVIDPIAALGDTVNVRFQAGLRFTAADGTPTTRVLDETVALVVSAPP
ncbi:MAG: hypothetical protein IV100_11400 [Myxococcales bacterium]|nr:hypothetical protein [Myxococcales bacterium]